MAKTLTIQRFDGSTWEELYPKTTIEQVVGLEDALAGKQTILTLADGEDTAIGGTVDVSPTSESTNLVSSGGVFSAISDVMEVAEGKTATYTTYLLKHEYTSSGSTVTDFGIVSATSPWTTESTPFTYSNIDGTTIFFDVVASNTDHISLNSNATYIYVLQNNGSSYYAKSIPISELKTGDVFYVVDVDYPDFWWNSSINYTVSPNIPAKTLYKLETAKVPISNYSLKSDTIKDVKYESNKLQKKVNGTDSYTDIMSLSLNNSTGAITIGTVTKTPLYSHQTMYYREIKVGGTTKIADSASTALDFKNTHSVQHTYDGGLHSFVMSQTTAAGDNRVTGEIAFIIPTPSS